MFTRLRACTFLLGIAAFGSGCAGQHNELTRAQECATELNTNTRFGRMQLASEYVAPKEKKAFFERHASWGQRVRVLDTEMIGMDVTEQGTGVNVSVKVAWTFVDDQDLRVTVVNQKWKQAGEGWNLTHEERLEGDHGLFGEKVIFIAPPEQRTNQFATIHIR